MNTPSTHLSICLRLESKGSWGSSSHASAPVRASLDLHVSRRRSSDAMSPFTALGRPGKPSCDTPCLLSCMQYADGPLLAPWIQYSPISSSLSWNRNWREKPPPLAILIFPVRPKFPGCPAGRPCPAPGPRCLLRTAAGHSNRTTVRRGHVTGSWPSSSPNPGTRELR
jgi:hypothetical protein